MRLTPSQLARLAADTGFQTHNLEKVLRLIDLLNGLRGSIARRRPPVTRGPGRRLLRPVAKASGNRSRGFSAPRSIRRVGAMAAPTR